MRGTSFQRKMVNHSLSRISLYRISRAKRIVIDVRGRTSGRPVNGHRRFLAAGLPAPAPRVSATTAAGWN